MNAARRRSILGSLRRLVAKKIGALTSGVTVPFRVEASHLASARSGGSLGGSVMPGIDTIFEWGRRGSDRAMSAPAVPVQDPLLEAAIAHEQIEVLYQPLIEPRTGLIVGAEALARSSIVPSAEVMFARATSAGLAERCRGSSSARRCAVRLSGKVRSRNSGSP